jgi:hypothetical protein
VGDAVKAFSALSQNRFGCPVRIFLNLVVPELEDRPALAFKECGSTGVILDGACMLAAIKLDRQFCFPAGEVDDEWLDDWLTSEAGAVAAQANPQQALSLGRTVAKRARKRRKLAGNPLHC